MRTAVEGFFMSPMNGMLDMARVFLRHPRLLMFLPLFGKSFEGVMRGYFKDERVLDPLSYPGTAAFPPPSPRASSPSFPTRNTRGPVFPGEG